MKTVPAIVRSYVHFINGKEIGSGRPQIERCNPATGKLVARFADGTAADVRAAVSAARKAFDEGPWPHMRGADRAKALRTIAGFVDERRDELARIEAEEVGKPISVARNDIGAVIDQFEYAASLAYEVHGDSYANLGDAHLAYVLKQPVGVAGLIIPWNFPAGLFSQKVPYALAAGCTAVAKPSEFTSGTALEISRLAPEAGIPAGVLNVVTGYGETVGQALVESPDVDFVSFTGSTAVGRKIAATAAKTHKRVSLELGGKSASIVFADAELDDAVEGVLFAVCFNTGECCACGSRLLVEQTIADAFLDRLVARAQELRLGEPLDEDADMCALIHQDHLEKVLAYVESGKSEGARLLTGGHRVDRNGGAFIEPTIFDGVQPSMKIFREEIFGPVLSVTRFRDLDEAIALANASAYGLINSVWTKNIDAAVRLTRALRSGSVFVNTTLESAPQTPFGGTKASGYGREMGRAGLEEFLELKSCIIRTTPYQGFPIRKKPATN